ncbi:hypothetical protein EDD16DRAFT_1476939, partial [Pisolithus croceorrhizus]
TTSWGNFLFYSDHITWLCVDKGVNHLLITPKTIEMPTIHITFSSECQKGGLVLKARLSHRCE